METIFIVSVNYLDWDNCDEVVSRVFINEEDAKGYCNLMNQGREDSCVYTYSEYKICTKDYKKFA